MGRARPRVGRARAHLSHSEGHCYRLRLDRFMNEERPKLEPDDAQFYLDLYRNADPEGSFDHFEEQRESNIEFLRNLPAGAGERKALHKDHRASSRESEDSILQRAGEPRRR